MMFVLDKSRLKCYFNESQFADMAELADAPDLGSGVPDVQVQVLLPALNGAKPNPVYFFKKVFAVVVNFARR